ncbi:hypothetical protein BLOT_009276 [Blomia tropicalis]|nr:hypothetical protein BLOT_009276 [Blomia tropicalis]
MAFLNATKFSILLVAIACIQLSLALNDKGGDKIIIMPHKHEHHKYIPYPVYYPVHQYHEYGHGYGHGYDHGYGGMGGGMGGGMK